MSNRLSKTNVLILTLAIYAHGCGDSGEEGSFPPGQVLNPATPDAGGTGSTPSGTGSTPSGTGSTPTGTGSTPTGTGSTPTGTGSTPTGTGGKDAGTPTTDKDAGGTTPVDTGTPASDGGAPSPDGGGTKPVTPGGSCLEGISGFDKTGPFKYSAKPQGVIKFWVPEVPAGCKVPVVHLANGTGASCSNYQQVLNQLASHGFLTACYENTNTGAGTQGLKAFETAVEKFPELVDMRMGSMGHSQGGQAAFTVLQLTEAKFGDKAIYAGLAMQPASGFGTQPSGGSWQSVYAKIKSPMFMFSGTADILVSESWVQQGFNALNDSVEAYWYSGVGSTHIPTPQEHTLTVAVSWFRWKLLGDKAACEYFKKLPDGSQWDKRKAQAEQPCQ